MGISPGREIGFVLQESPRQLEGARVRRSCLTFRGLARSGLVV